jgi:2-polyprenyl-3-methyl-5-hydroxy-6-metoxy-1,4-benzoquinol methylase
VYKTIIPGLVTLDTEIEKILGSYLFRKLNFFPPRKSKSRYHYKVNIGNIKLPKEFDFRNGYYLKKGNFWYYERKFLGLSLKMQYDTKTNTFKFNQLYGLIPIEFGSILPMGKHIADIINLNLTVDGYVVIRGYSYKKNGKIVAIIQPSFSGKTSMLRHQIRLGAKYISEDILVIDPKNSLIYPTMAIDGNYGRNVNRKLYGLAKNNALQKSQKLSRLDFKHLSVAYNKISINQTMQNYYLLNALLFMDNRFIRGVITNDKQGKKVILNIKEFVSKNYDVDIISVETPQSNNAQHWQELGGDYSKVWQSPAKKILSTKEIGFLQKYIPKKAKNVMDVGIGTGRIIEAIITREYPPYVYGVDVASNMVKYCKRKFNKSSYVKKLVVLDISQDQIPFKKEFDSISAVRVLKYNENWEEILRILTFSLKPNGTLIFSMPNKKSLNIFGHYAIPFSRTTPTGIQTIISSMGMEIIEMKSFSRLPDKLYELSNNQFYNSLLTFSENIFAKFGKVYLGREIFVAIRRHKKI